MAEVGDGGTAKGRRTSDKQMLTKDGFPVTSESEACYRIWYKHSLEPECTDFLNSDPHLTQISLSDLAAATDGLDITHMIISGDIPPTLGQIAPDLKQLRLIPIHHQDLLQSICLLPARDWFHVSYNSRPQTLPDDIGMLKSLKVLSVWDRYLTRLPTSVCSLPALEKLHVSGNSRLQTLPDDIGMMKSLKELYMSNCDLTHLPTSIGQLINIESLDISYNRRLTTIPESLISINALHQLECEGCDGLISPPLSLCKLGLEAMRGHLKHLKVWQPSNNSKSKILKELIEKHPLDTKDIKLLFDHSDQYIIPHHQTHVKRCGLVLFNSDKREGAVEEANAMSENLTKSGIQTKTVEWKQDYYLFAKIHDELTGLISDGLSLLIVSIMSHGTAGILTGINDSKIAISDVLKTLSVKLPKHIPLILIVQACQAYSDSGSQSHIDAGRAEPPKSYVVLERPHTLLLMSSVVGGMAVRGAFTGAMARQFAKANGKTTINDMVTNAVIDMKKNEPDKYNQSPESRNTLQKSLILPPGIDTPDSQQHSEGTSKESLLKKLLGK